MSEENTPKEDLNERINARKKSDDEKKQEKDGIMNLWMSNMGDDGSAPATADPDKVDDTPPAV